MEEEEEEEEENEDTELGAPADPEAVDGGKGGFAPVLLVTEASAAPVSAVFDVVDFFFFFFAANMAST